MLERSKLTLAPSAVRELDSRLAGIRTELGIAEGYPLQAVREAEASARACRQPAQDRTDVELVTLDPLGSRDLDQAFGIVPDGSGWVVSYAIADVAAFVTPGGRLDVETHRRGETVYGPDHRAPLHPDVLGTGAASLLPGVDRPALLWTHRITSTGETADSTLARAVVRSRVQLDYDSAQRAVADGTATGPIALLAAVGPALLESSRARAALSLPRPEQVVDGEASSGWELAFRRSSPVEEWNAQLSLATGVAAAAMMLDAGIGLLRTLPPPDANTVNHLRAVAKALRVVWPEGVGVAQFVTGLDPTRPGIAALLQVATSLLRGAGYTALPAPVGSHLGHTGIGAAYAHATAPLRRLADRYVGEVCVAVSAKQSVPEWVSEALTALPGEMAAADHRSHAYDRAVLDLVEALILRGHEGEIFEAVVISAGARDGQVQVREPAVMARCEGNGLPVGQPVQVRLKLADPDTRTVVFVPA